MPETDKIARMLEKTNVLVRVDQIFNLTTDLACLHEFHLSGTHNTLAFFRNEHSESKCSQHLATITYAHSKYHFQCGCFSLILKY